MSEMEPQGVAGGLPDAGTPTQADGASITDVTRPGPAVVAEQVVSTPPPGAGRRPAGMLRWAVALLVVALLVGVTSVAAVILTGSSTPSSVEGWIPNGTIGWLEVRGDMPGDQKAKVGDILARFPGFKDQASLDSKIDEAFDKLLAKSGVSWTADLKPWVAGDMGIAISGNALDMSGLSGLGMYNSMGGVPIGGSDAAAATPVTDRAVAILSVKDGAAAEAFVKAKAGGSPTTSTYGGGNLTTLAKGALTMAWATRGNVLLIGYVDNVKSALDTAGKGSFATSAQFAEAKKVAPSGYLGFGYLDAKAYLDAMLKSFASQSANTATSDLVSCMGIQMTTSSPGWIAGTVQARDGELYMEADTSGAGTSAPANVTDSLGTVSSRLPATTVYSQDIRDLGIDATAAWSVYSKLLSCSPTTKQQFDQIQKALNSVGGIDGILGWAGDSSIAITRSGTNWGGGIASVARDAAGAKLFFNQAQALISVAGATAGITSSLTDYGGGKLITISVPAGTGVPDIGIGLRNDLFVVGTADFVKATFDTKDGAGLAAQPRYQKAIAAVGNKAIEELYVDITGIREGAEAVLAERQPDAVARYQTEVMPFLEPFDSFALIVSTPGSGSTSIKGALVFK